MSDHISQTERYEVRPVMNFQHTGALASLISNSETCCMSLGSGVC
jgi:hypothetical protein